MAKHEPSPISPTLPLQKNLRMDPHRWSAARIAGAYLIAGLIWIGLSDLTLKGAGGLTAEGFRVSAGKGSLFVLVSSGLVLWLCRREYRNTLRSMTLLRAVVEGTSDAVFVKDRDGKYQFVNSAGARFMGKAVADVLGRDDRTLFEASEGEQLVANDRKIMEGGKVVSIEERLTSAGDTRTYQAIKAPYFDAAGKVAGLIGISRNVTDRAQIEATLRETDARLREAQRIARLGSWSWEPPTDRVWWSDAEFELFGLETQAVRPSFEAFLSLLHPDDRPIAIARVEAMRGGADQLANDLRILRADGSILWIHSQARATRDDSGNLVRVEGTDQDITTQRLAQEAIQDSEQRLQAAIEVAGLGIIVVDHERQTVELSTRAGEQFGLAANTTLSRQELHDRFHPDDSGRLALLIQGAMDQASVAGFALEHRIVRPDGTTRWLNVRKQISFVNGLPQKAIVVTADVTDRRQAEARLREQEMLEREAAVLAKVGGWGFDPVTMEADWTPEVAHMYGLDPNAPPALSDAIRFFNEDQRPALESALADAMSVGTPHDMELQLTAADGEKKWVRTICRPIIENGRVVRVRGSLQDITDRKRVESELRASEERYRMLFESNPHPMWVYDVESLELLAVNDAAILEYGYSRDEFLKMTIRDIRPPEDILKLEQDVARSKRGFSRSVEWRHRRKDGTVFDVDVSSHDLPEQQGHSRLVLALDITDGKRAEMELQASERRLRLALEAAGAIAFAWDIPTDTVTRYFSKEPALPATSEQVGTLAEVRAQIHPDDLVAFDRSLSDSMSHGTEYTNRYRVLRSDGSIACLEEFGFLDRAPDGAPLRLTGMSIDVTDRVAATELLRESEERLRVALKAARGGAWDWDLVGGNAWWSPEMYELMGASMELESQEAKSVDLIHDEDRPKVQAAIADAIANKTDYHCEFRVHGGTRWLSSNASLALDPNGNPVRLVGISWDITDRVVANESLRLSEARYRQLVDMLPTAIFVHADNTILFGNPAFLHLMGASSPSELLGGSPFQLLHASSHDILRRRQAELEQTRVVLPGCEMLGVRCDGRPIPLHVVVAPIEGYGRAATLVALSDLTERERSLALLRSVLDSVDDAILTIGDDGEIRSANQSTERMFGYNESEILGMHVRVIVPELYGEQNHRPIANYLSMSLGRVIGVGREVECQRKDGSNFPAELTCTEFLRDGELEFTAVIRDITTRRHLEEQFRQAQKMDAVGRLAGGVAHDFNNLLTIINGYSEVLLAGLSVEDPSRGPLAAIYDAGDRAARLTQQLLALSRKSMVQPRLIDLNELVSESVKLFRRLIGEDIGISVLTDPTPVHVVLDPGQLEQVLMNLAVNARDAMPTGGRLTIETRNVVLGSISDPTHPNLLAGRYALMRVTDTGCGMKPEIKEKIFEPFFTTKGIGKGTGLGLSVVHGVVQQSGGSISVESLDGIGTTFEILLPAAKLDIAESSAVDKPFSRQGVETILVTEDEEAVRTLVQFALEEQGYTVLTFSTGEEALVGLETYSGKIDLLLTDVIMPGMSGRELVDRARAARSEMRVLFMSGYTDDALDRHGLRENSDHFIQKPFTPLGLVRRVREVLDQSNSQLNN